MEALKRGNSAEDEGSKTEDKSIGDDRVGRKWQCILYVVWYDVTRSSTLHSLFSFFYPSDFFFSFFVFLNPLT